MNCDRHLSLLASGHFECPICLAHDLNRLQNVLARIIRECDALNKGPVAVMIAREALTAHKSE